MFLISNCIQLMDKMSCTHNSTFFALYWNAGCTACSCDLLEAGAVLQHYPGLVAQRLWNNITLSNRLADIPYGYLT